MWFLLALSGAFCTTAAEVLIKRAAGKIPVNILILASWLYSLPLLAAMIPFAEIEAPPAAFWAVVAAMVPLEVAGAFLYIRAITTAPLSLSAPFLSFTPLLLVLTGASILGEVLPAAGVIGVILVAAGAYCMNIGDMKKGLFKPVAAMFRLQGPRLALGAAALYAITSALAKKAIMLSHPYLFTAIYVSILTVVFAVSLAVRGRRLAPVVYCWKTMLPVGVFLGAAAIFMNLAFLAAPVAYAIAVKRLSLVLSVIAGRFLFGEGRFAERFVGAALMVGGVVILALVR
jgi:drug/metabolite transporter (DMT)-like permease